MVYHPDRILTPLKRTADGFEEISLGQALDEIAARVAEVIERHGARAVGVWKGEAIGFGQQENLARRFVHALGSPNYLSNDSMCYAARYCGYKLVDGDWPVPDLENARCIVMWGANPPYAHPNMTQYITARAPQRAPPSWWSTRACRPSPAGPICTRPCVPAPTAPWHGASSTRLIETDAYDQGLRRAPHRRLRARWRVRRGVHARGRGEGDRRVGSHGPGHRAGHGERRAPRGSVYVGNGLEHHENGVNNVRAIAMFDGLLGDRWTRWAATGSPTA